MWDDVLVMLGDAITKLRADHDPLDVANDLALVHAAVSARRDRAERDGVPHPDPTRRGSG